MMFLMWLAAIMLVQCGKLNGNNDTYDTSPKHFHNGCIQCKQITQVTFYVKSQNNNKCEKRPAIFLKSSYHYNYEKSSFMNLHNICLKSNKFHDKTTEKLFRNMKDYDNEILKESEKFVFSENTKSDADNITVRQVYVPYTKTYKPFNLFGYLKDFFTPSLFKNHTPCIECTRSQHTYIIDNFKHQSRLQQFYSLLYGNSINRNIKSNFCIKKQFNLRQKTSKKNETNLTHMEKLDTVNTESNGSLEFDTDKDVIKITLPFEMLNRTENHLHNQKKVFSYENWFDQFIMFLKLKTPLKKGVENISYGTWYNKFIQYFKLTSYKKEEEEKEEEDTSLKVTVKPVEKTNLLSHKEWYIRFILLLKLKTLFQKKDITNTTYEQWYYKFIQFFKLNCQSVAKIPSNIIKDVPHAIEDIIINTTISVHKPLADSEEVKDDSDLVYSEWYYQRFSSYMKFHSVIQKRTKRSKVIVDIPIIVIDDATKAVLQPCEVSDSILWILVILSMLVAFIKRFIPKTTISPKPIQSTKTIIEPVIQPYIGNVIYSPPPLGVLERPIKSKDIIIEPIKSKDIMIEPINEQIDEHVTEYIYEYITEVIYVMDTFSPSEKYFHSSTSLKQNVIVTPDKEKENFYHLSPSLDDDNMNQVTNLMQSPPSSDNSSYMPLTPDSTQDSRYKGKLSPIPAVVLAARKMFEYELVTAIAEISNYPSQGAIKFS